MDSVGELSALWDKIPANIQLRNENFDIGIYKKLLEIFKVGEYYYFLVDVRQAGIIYVSKSMEKILGYCADELDLAFYLSLLHPEDLPYLMNFEVAVEKFFGSIQPENIFNYKVQYDFRIRKANGQYMRVLHHIIVLQHDPQSIKTMIIDTDITHLGKESVPILSFIGMNGAPTYNNVDIEIYTNSLKNMFTRREAEILDALAKGMSSIAIAESFNISKLTVDSHRKNILRKAGAKTMAEAIRIAIDKGWF